MSQREEERIRAEDRQQDRQLTANSQSMAMQSALRKQEEKIQNPNFLRALTDSDLNINVGDDTTLEELFPTWFSSARAVSNRNDNWDQQADLFMRNKRERRVSQRKPGKLLRDRPFLLATMQGKETPTLDAYRSPEIPGDTDFWKHRVESREEINKQVTPDQISMIYGAAEVAADQMTLSRNAAGLEATSTATTETRVTKNEKEENAKRSIGKVLK